MGEACGEAPVTPAREMLSLTPTSRYPPGSEKASGSLLNREDTVYRYMDNLAWPTYWHGCLTTARQTTGQHLRAQLGATLSTVPPQRESEPRAQPCRSSSRE